MTLWHGVCCVGDVVPFLLRFLLSLQFPNASRCLLPGLSPVVRRSLRPFSRNAPPPARRPSRCAGPTRDTVESTPFVERHYELIRDRIDCLCRRSGMGHDEREDFESWALLRLIEKSPALDQTFEGRCALTTFLDTVVKNLQRDFRISNWGKWRSSARARELGTLAVALERLLYRERLPAAEAVQCVVERVGCWQPTRRKDLEDELWGLMAELPIRFDRRPVHGADVLRHVPDESAERDLSAPAACREMDRVTGALQSALSGLSPHHREVLELRYVGGHSFEEIGERTGMRVQTLYGIVARSMKKLRRELEESGVRGIEALDAHHKSGEFCVERLFRGVPGSEIEN